MDANTTETATRLIIEEAYEPGNATRYELLLMEPNPGDHYRVFIWINAPGGGRAMRLAADSILHVSYLSEKIRCNDVDGMAMLEWLKEQGVPVYL